MNKLAFLIVFILLSSSGIIYAQTASKQDSIDVFLDHCMAIPENQTTVGMCDCIYKSLAMWDKKLNNTYKQILLKLNPIQKQKLISSQRQWVIFKEKEISLIDETYGKAQGTMWLMVRADAVMQITRSRTNDLELLLTSLEDF